jgi:isocitrate/isopropylmalate dehydrogenase
VSKLVRKYNDGEVVVGKYKIAVIEGDGIGREVVPEGQHLGEPRAARSVERAFEAVLTRPDLRTPDLGGKASTRDVGEAIAQEISVVAEP